MSFFPTCYDIQTGFLSNHTDHNKKLFYFKNSSKISDKFTSCPNFSKKFNKALEFALWLNDFIKNFIDMIADFGYENILFLCAKKIFSLPQAADLQAKYVGSDNTTTETNSQLDQSNELKKANANSSISNILLGHSLNEECFNNNFYLKNDFLVIKNCIQKRPLLSPFYLIAAAIYIPLKISFIAIKLITTVEKLLVSTVLLSINLLAHAIIHIPTVPKILYNKYLSYKKESNKKKILSDDEVLRSFSNT